MPALPPRPDLDQLRRIAKERLREARGGDPDAIRWIGDVGAGRTLAAAQLRLARDHGFASWPEMQLEVARRRVLDLHDADALAAFVADHPELAAADLKHWRDHPKGASPLSYLAMARYDTARHAWRDVTGTAAAAHVLIAAGADLDATARHDAGGVPGGSALLHAAVFGMVDVVDVLVAAGARVRSIEEAAAAGDITGWLSPGTPPEARLRALIMAADHQRLGVIDALIAAGTPVDAEDALFHRHPLRLAAANGRPDSVRALLAHGADPTLRDSDGLTPLDHSRRGRTGATDVSGHDEVDALLARPSEPPV